MKLASLKGGRDGRLVVVSNDLAWFTEAHHIAPTLQAALDHWAGVEPVLRGLAESLEHEAVPKERFHEHQAASLSVGRRVGLCEPRGPGAPGARRRDAGKLLDRSLDVPGRVRRVPGPARPDPAC